MRGVVSGAPGAQGLLSCGDKSSGEVSAAGSEQRTFWSVNGTRQIFKEGWNLKVIHLADTSISGKPNSGEGALRTA